MNTSIKNEKHDERLENLTDLILSSCCFYGNDSEEPFWPSRGNMTTHLLALKTFQAKMNQIVIPLICLFGVIGNSFSIYVFSRRWLTKYMDQLERSATAGLISLSLSDGAFCLVALPALFLRPPSSPPTKNGVLYMMALYYNNYHSPVTNLFLLNSTWIIVLISLERFIAVSYAFKARWMIRVRVTVIIHVTVFVTSVVICLPLLLRNRIKWVPCGDDRVCVHTETWFPLTNQHFRVAYKIVWATVGTFIPLFLIVVSSIRLLVDLYRSKAFGFADPDRYCTPQITTMITSILLSFIALVCPSMILECVVSLPLSEGRLSRGSDYTYWMALLLTNLLQAVKFAFNFLLYCAVSREFRKHFNFRRLRESFTTSARQQRRRQEALQRTIDGSSSASACQLIALHSQSRTPSQDGKEFSNGKPETSH